MSDYYEDPDILSEYLLFHYGTAEQVLPWQWGPHESVDFPRRIAHQFHDYYPRTLESDRPLRALDLGCAVGRSSFELTRWFGEVVGVDYSHAFIEGACALARTGKLDYRIRVQGEQFTSASCAVPEGTHADRLRFLQGDAMELDGMKLGTFDLILASNLICRLPDPGSFLAGLPSMLRPEGLLVLSTPYTYMESFTEKDRWLGGQAGGPAAGEAVASVLSKRLTQLDQADTPMLIREHARKYQWTVCHTSLWKQT